MAAARSTLPAPCSLVLVQQALPSMVSMARREALNSTGSVTSWKNVVRENSRMPMPKQRLAVQEAAR